MKRNIKKPMLLGLAVMGAATIANHAHAAVELKASGFGSFYVGSALSDDLMPLGFSGPSGYPDKATTSIYSGKLNSIDPSSAYNAPSGFQNHLANFTDFSLVGADLALKLNDNFKVATEILAAGEPVNQGGQQFMPALVWGFLNWTPMKDTSFKLGRQRYAIWTASEYIYNHEQLPYRQVPDIAYRVLPFSSFDGFSISQNLDLNSDYSVKFAIFGGTPLLGINLDATQYQFSGKNLFGAILAFDGDGFRVRGQISRLFSELDIEPANSLVQSGLTNQSNKANVTVASTGYRYDKNNIVSWGEYAVYTSSDGNLQPDYTGTLAAATKAATAYAAAAQSATVAATLGTTQAEAAVKAKTYATEAAQVQVLVNLNRGTQSFKTGQAGYLMLGYRLGNLMPRFTYSQAFQNIGFELGKVTSFNAGVNYEISDQMVARLDWEMTQVDQNMGNTNNTLIGYQKTANSYAMPDLSGTGATGHSLYLGIDFQI